MEQGPAAESSSVINVGRSWHVGEKRAEATEQQYCARRARVVSLPPSPIRLANNDESGLAHRGAFSTCLELAPREPATQSA